MKQDVFNLIISRRTIHNFADKEVPSELIKMGIESALRAPNHKLTHPWGFIEIGPELRGAVANLVLKEKEEASVRPFSDKKREQIRAPFLQVPHLIVAVQHLEGDEYRQKEDYAACACGIQNFSLVMWENGIGSKWSTPAVIYSPQLYELLDIDSEKELVIGFLLVGYPENVTDTIRPAFEEVYRITK